MVRCRTSVRHAGALVLNRALDPADELARPAVCAQEVDRMQLQNAKPARAPRTAKRRPSASSLGGPWCLGGLGVSYSRDLTKRTQTWADEAVWANAGSAIRASSKDEERSHRNSEPLAGPRDTN